MPFTKTVISSYWIAVFLKKSLNKSHSLSSLNDKCSRVSMWAWWRTSTAAESSRRRKRCAAGKRWGEKTCMNPSILFLVAQTGSTSSNGEKFGWRLEEPLAWCIWCPWHPHCGLECSPVPHYLDWQLGETLEQFGSMQMANAIKTDTPR